MLIRIEVDSFGVEPATGSPVLVLREASGKRTIPVAIGTVEAGVIAMKSLEVATDLPVTIDLVNIVADRLGGRIDSVVLHDVTESGIVARLYIVSPASRSIIECRVSDALCLAFRCGVPVYADEKVFDKVIPCTENSSREKLRKVLAETDTVDFGRYHLE